MESNNLSAGQRVIVVGGGVVGMTTALVLAEEGYSVDLWYGRHWSQCTSNVAAALWRPVTVGRYSRAWASATYHYLRSLASLPDTGVQVFTAYEYFDLSDEAEMVAHLEANWWRNLPGVDFRRNHAEHCREADFGPEIGTIKFQHGFQFNTCVVRMPDYLGWLEQQLLERGVTLTQRWVGSLQELTQAPAEWKINCTGYAAAGWMADAREQERCLPLEGLVLRVQAEGVTHLSGVHTGRFAKEPLYIVPRSGSSRDVILGGSIVPRPGYDPRGELPKPDLALAETILRRCQAVEPALRHLRGLQDVESITPLAGLRPYRDVVRLEYEPIGQTQVIHNYGHGGSGVTLSYGCALAVRELIRVNSV